MGCGVTAPCRGVAAGAERPRFCFVLQLCPVIDLVTRLVGIQLLGTVSGAFLVEQGVLPPRGPCGPVVGRARSVLLTPLLLLAAALRGWALEADPTQLSWGVWAVASSSEHPTEGT